MSVPGCRLTKNCFASKGTYVADLIPRVCELELSIGDTIQVGNQFLTVVDIEGDEILFQLDTGHPADSTSSSGSDSPSCR